MISQWNLVLVGFMATGKTEVGRLSAREMEREFFDVDDYIVSTTGFEISEIFEEYGEEFFRDLETGVIKRVSSMKELVITTGGGTLLRRENLENLKKTGVLVCLEASPLEIVRRVEDDKHRPLLDVDDRLNTVEKMLSQRKAYYDLADIKIETEGKDPATTAKEVVDQFIWYLKKWKT